MRLRVLLCALTVSVVVCAAVQAQQQSAARVQAEQLFVEAQKALSRGDSENAEALLKNALAQDPAFTSAIWQLAQIYESRGRLDYARELLMRGLKQDPGASWARERLAQLEGTIARTILVEARTHLNSGEYDLAIPKFTTYLGLKPNDTDALVAMAKCQLAKGRTKSAREYLARARAIDPDDAGAASVVAEINKIDRNARLEKLLSDAQIALMEETEPGSEKARTALQAVLDEDPANAWAKERLVEMSRSAAEETAKLETHAKQAPKAVVVQSRKALVESKGALSTATRFLLAHLALLILAAVLCVLVIDIRRKTMRRSYPLEGTITLIPILDIVSLVNANLRTGRLIVASADAKGEIYFEQGEIIHAKCDGLTGKTAFYKLMDLRSGRFFFHNHLPNVRRTITDPLSLLLLSMKPHEESAAEVPGAADRKEFASTHK
jgi:tetratricopeptide (TPR) repeat protein